MPLPSRSAGECSLLPQLRRRDWQASPCGTWRSNITESKGAKPKAGPNWPRLYRSIARSRAKCPPDYRDSSYNEMDFGIQTLGPVYIHLVQRTVATRLMMAAKHLGTSKNRPRRSRATKLPPNDSALFPFRFADVHSRRVRDLC